MVDDDFAVVELVKANLEAVGLEVITAYDGLQALDVISQLKPDIVILDVRMPRLDGWDVLWELRNSQETHNLPIIMLTVQSDGESITRGWSNGVDCYLPKPFDPAELVAMTKRLLELENEGVWSED